MQRLIDANEIEKVLEEKHFNRVLDSDRWIIADIKKSIMDLPTIEAVPVIRCKNCIHCADDWNGNQPTFTCELGKAGESVQPNDYCSYAERIGEE